MLLCEHVTSKYTCRWQDANFYRQNEDTGQHREGAGCLVFLWWRWLAFLEPASHLLLALCVAHTLELLRLPSWPVVHFMRLQGEAPGELYLLFTKKWVLSALTPAHLWFSCSGCRDAHQDSMTGWIGCFYQIDPIKLWRNRETSIIRKHSSLFLKFWLPFVSPHLVVLIFWQVIDCTSVFSGYGKNFAINRHHHRPRREETCHKQGGSP